MSGYAFSSPGESGRPFLEAASSSCVKLGRLPWSRWKPILRCHKKTASLTPVRTLATHYLKFTFFRNVLKWVDQHLNLYFDTLTAHCEQCINDAVSRGYPAEKLGLAICGYPGLGMHLTAAVQFEILSQMGIGKHQRVSTYEALGLPEIAGSEALYVDPHSTESILNLRETLIARGLNRAKDFTWANQCAPQAELRMQELSSSQISIVKERN